MKIWALILGATLLFYGTSLRYGFSQDDFYFLLISQADTLGNVLRFFSPLSQQGFPFYRPLGTQLYYFLFTGIFGFPRAAFFMHIAMLLVQATNGYLVYRLSSRLRLPRNLAVMTGLLYATSAVHFLSLFYIAATQQLLAALFGLISLIAFFDRRPWRTGIFFLLALLSKESASVVPVIAFLLWQFTSPQLGKFGKLGELAKLMSPFVVVGIGYLALRLLGGITVQSEYQPVIGPSLISTLRWYFLFAYGAPEELIRYAIPGMFINFWRYIRDFGTIGLVSALTTISLSLYSLYILVKSTIVHRPLTILQLILYVLWWLAGIGLIIWFPDHRYPHYLDLGLIPLLLIVLHGLSDRGRLIVGALLLASSYSAITISLRTHWTVGRAEIAREAVARLESSGACGAGAIDFDGPGVEPRELSYVLSLANGPRYICHKPDLKVYYDESSVVIPPGTVVISTEGLFP